MRILILVLACLFVTLCGVAETPAQFPANQPTPLQPRPRMEALAETSLLMNGLLQSNLRGLGRSFAQKPTDAEAWAFARGQSLLIGEGGNLLMIRPPQGAGQAPWWERSVALRESASKLARSAAAQDYEACKTNLVELTSTCNKCHQTFRVPAKANPFAVDQ